MTILVTGATGFIGEYVTRALLSAGHPVKALVRLGRKITLEHPGLTVAQGDVRDRAAMAQVMLGCDGVVHLAALYALWSANPQEIYDVNVLGTRNVMEAAGEAGVKRIVYTSTVATVRFHEPPRLGNEDEDPNPQDLVGHYKRSKYQAELQVRHMADQGLPAVIVNPTAPMGAGDARPTPTSQIILDVLRGRMPAYIDTGLNLVDVEDVALGHLLALEKGKTGRRYILGNRNVTLREMLEMVASIAGKKPPRWRMPYWVAVTAGYLDLAIEGKVLRRAPRIPLDGVKQARKYMWVDCSRAVSELGMPQSPVEEALEKAIQWYLEKQYVLHDHK